MNETATRNPAYRVETERLLLRCWQPTDAPALRAALDRSDHHLRPWIPFMKDEPRTVEQTVEWLRGHRTSFDLGQNFRYAVFEREGGALVGENMLLDRVGAGGMEIGYLTHLGFEGRGYANEATCAMIRLAFEHHGVDRVEIHCSPENRASAAIPARLGFEHEATLKRRVVDTEGAIHDLMIWTLFATDYERSSLCSVELAAFDALDRPVLAPAGSAPAS